MEKVNPMNQNIINKNYKKNIIIEELCSTQNEILILGDSITNLFFILKKVLEGNNNCIDECKTKVNDIISKIEKIRKNLHELVDKVYSKKNFAFISKLNNDLKEKEKEVNKNINIFKNINIKEQPHIQHEKPTFNTISTSRK